MEKISIVIPVMKLKKSVNPRFFYKKRWSIIETLESIEQALKNVDHEFVFVQNGIDKDLTNFLFNFLKSFKGRVVQISENVGVSKAWNIGISACDSSIVIISNDDVEFKENSIDVLIETLIKNDEVAQVGPEGGDWNFDCSGPRKGKLIIEEVDEISGYFFIIKRKHYEIVGGFDENYSPAGVEEIDFSFKLRNKGFRCLVVPNTGIVHHGFHGVSTKPQIINYLDKSIDTHSLDKRNKSYFVDKWFKRS